MLSGRHQIMHLVVLVSSPGHGRRSIIPVRLKRPRIALHRHTRASRQSADSILALSTRVQR